MSIRALCIGGVLIAISVYASDLKPGVDRWGVKTSVSKDQFKNGTPKKVTKMKLEDLLKFPPPDPKKYDYKTFDAQTTEIDRMRGQDANRPQEGDIVRTDGFVQLIMLSDDGAKHRDGDYHVQITSDVKDRSKCLIVEVPFEDFVTDSNIPDEAALRDTLRKKLKPSKGEFSKSGSCMTHPPRMAITGQLFYDVHHAAGSSRGRHGCTSPTEWELHPVFKMQFLDPVGTSPDVGKCLK
ncbi:MAG: hypothetical protein JWN45_3052 [Acidobacteriaceae bacterium]|nr:hypothetical protein [Acidobacteriaceae bacterium]